MGNLKIGFLGAGKMACALASGLVKADVASAKDLLASDVSADARASFSKNVGCRVTSSNVEVADTSDVLILAVKPDQIAPLLQGLAGHIEDRHLVISIAAGVTIAQLESTLREGIRIVRVMPNTRPARGSPRATSRSNLWRWVSSARTVPRKNPWLGRARNQRGKTGLEAGEPRSLFGFMAYFARHAQGRVALPRRIGRPPRWTAHHP